MTTIEEISVEKSSEQHTVPDIVEQYAEVQETQELPPQADNEQYTKPAAKPRGRPRKAPVSKPPPQPKGRPRASAPPPAAYDDPSPDPAPIADPPIHSSQSVTSAMLDLMAQHKRTQQDRRRTVYNQWALSF